MNMQKLISEIIPPSDYQHRDGFTNIHIINALGDHEKEQVEDALIYKLLYETEKNVDTLIVETLAYLKSKKSLPILKDLLEKSSNEMEKLIIATSIFEINQDSDMISSAVASFKQIDNIADPYSIYKLADAFSYLKKLKSENVNKIIEEYTKRPEVIVSSNAKRALGI